MSILKHKPILERFKLKHLEGKRDQNQTFVLVILNVMLKHCKKKKRFSA